MTGADLLHGGALGAMRGAFPDSPAPWVDLSTGINPWPYPVAVEREDWTRLPSREAFLACRDAMAAAWRAPREAVLPVPGTELAIRLLPSLIAGQDVAVLGPTYDDHARAWRTAERTVREVHDACDLGRADVAVLCNPNNPDGRIHNPADLLTLGADCVVIDEAYAECCPDISLAPRAGQQGLVVLRSFGKFYGLAGVRLGAVLGPPPLLASLASLIGGWSVSGPALRLGAAAYADAPWREAMRRRLHLAAADLRARLEAGGLEVVGGTSLFTLARAPDAARRWHALARRGVYVRRFAHDLTLLRFGLPATATDADRLSAALTP